jgi:GDP-L-fucose synthase
MRQFSTLADSLEEEVPDVIINCAASVGSVHFVTKYGGDIIYDNTLMIANLYRALTHACPKAILINPIANCCYPGRAGIQYEPDWESGPVHASVLPFAATRRLIYSFAESYHKQYGIKSINWIMPNAYGPGDSTDPNKVHALNGIIIRLLKARKNNEKNLKYGEQDDLFENGYS